MVPVAVWSADGGQTELAQRICALSMGRWGNHTPTVLVGRDPSMLDAQARLLKFAQADSPVLITGETGTGKELFARALFLLSARRARPFLCINCAQFQDSQLLVSELFGHRKGSFTGAMTDRPGLFEDADGGVVFLDEIAELSLTAQAMLLRTLSEGEVVRVGESRPRQVHVRIIAATARNLEQMIAAGTFRADLYFRLRFLRLRVPPLRERGDDWRLTADYFLLGLNGGAPAPKHLSAAACDVLQTYVWPGNVRELKGIVDLGFHGSEGQSIEPEHFVDELSRTTTADAAPPTPAAARPAADPYERLRAQQVSFWSAVHRPFMERDLNRREVRALVARGLRESGGSYKQLLPIFGIDAADYLKFMDFLRHHDLKPS